ncbi:MAG TPA: VWA domain-containing protein [Thermoanaerobaculia bacterium]|nr:VWA domain-containing protein [Thermoanaerobaculia bacterium]
MTLFASPAWFVMLIGMALRLWLLVRDRRRGEGSFEISSFQILATQRSVSARFGFLPVVLEMIGWTLLIVALARPQQISSIAADDRYGIDIVIALDASGSMAAEDFRPRNRFTVAKSLIAQFIDRRENDRIGIVTFGARAATRVPITYDREIARTILQQASIGENGDGTAIGQAIATSVNRLRGSSSRSKVIILVTDGVNNAGSIEPITAAALAQSLEMKVYTVGVGSRGEVPIPVKRQNPFTGEIDTFYQLIRADLDEKMLTAIARQTGGEYFRAVDQGTLDSVLTRIDELEKTKLVAPKIRTVKELYHAPLLLGIGALCLALLFGETVWMRLPA